MTDYITPDGGIITHDDAKPNIIHMMTLDILEDAVRSMREVEAKEGFKIDAIMLLPAREQGHFLPEGGNGVFESALISRVEIDGKMKLIAVGIKEKNYEGAFWAVDPAHALREIGDTCTCGNAIIVHADTAEIPLDKAA